MSVEPRKLPLLEREVLVRRKGGSVIHVMQITENGHAPSTGAICGTVAQDSRYSSMSRAGWYQMRAATEPTCAKCNRILAGRLVQAFREKHPGLLEKFLDYEVDSEQRNPDDVGKA